MVSRSFILFKGNSLINTPRLPLYPVRFRAFLVLFVAFSNSTSRPIRHLGMVLFGAFPTLGEQRTLAPWWLKCYALRRKGGKGAGGNVTPITGVVRENAQEGFVSRLASARNTD